MTGTIYIKLEKFYKKGLLQQKKLQQPLRLALKQEKLLKSRVDRVKSALLVENFATKASLFRLVVQLAT